MTFLKKQYSWLISGGAGFIGSNLCNLLINNNQKVLCIDNFYTGKIKNISKLKKSKNFRLIKSDIRILKYSKLFRKIDYVIHLAALGSVSRSIKNPRETNSVNVDGSINLLELSKLMNAKKFIFASSSSVYGDLKKEFKVETDKTCPISPYGLSKLTFEKYAKIISKNNNLKVVGLRFFNVFGPHQNVEGDYAAVIANWSTQILNNKKIRLNGDGKTSRDFTHIDNVLEGIVRSCFYKQEKNFEIFNLACGNEVSLNALIKNIVKISGRKVKIIKRPFRDGDIKRSKANINKAKLILGYKVKTSFKEGIKKYIQYLSI